MPKKLFLIESPGKLKSLKKILGPEFDIVPTYGHCLDLDEKKLSVDIKKDFEPTLVVLPSKKEILNNIKKKAKKADEIYYATDPDREGCAIFFNVHNVLKNITKAKFYRASFNSITKNAVLDAVAHPRQVEDDFGSVEAQQSRRILDRLVGWKTSFLTKQATGGQSAGRVQSVALRIIAEREKEIKNFIPEEYWNITANLLSPKKEPFTVHLETKQKVKNEKEARLLYDKIKIGSPVVPKVEKKIVDVRPNAPFMTQSLISSAKNIFNWSNSKTMKIAQDLYEGTGSGHGFITYMRTDSCSVEPSFLVSIRECIDTKYGSKYFPDKPNIYKNKKSAQAGHTCCHPVDLNIEKPNVSVDHQKLYKLIWERTLASQSVSAIYNSVKITVDIAHFNFIANGSVLVFDGFKKIYDYTKNNDVVLPSVKEGDVCEFNMDYSAAKDSNEKVNLILEES